MKKICFLMFILLLCACGSKYSEEEKKMLEDYGVWKIANSNCQNKDSVKVMLASDDFEATLIQDYCSCVIEDSKGINAMLKAGLSEEEIKEYQSISYFKEENVERYLKYEADTIEEKILNVNMNLDLEPYAITNIVSDDSDMTLLINKYNALPEGYIPPDLVEVNYVCVQGEDYSCSTMDKMQLRKEAAEAYESFAVAALKENIEIRAIATYRSYDYQRMLYDYNKGIYGQEEADKYYARPGQSEHNSGLAVDITFNGHTFTEIEDKDGYEWILENMHKYGFILRYPKDKTEITRYGYESWHLRYVGVEAAKEIYENNLTLEEYIAMK